MCFESTAFWISIAIIDLLKIISDFLLCWNCSFVFPVHDLVQTIFSGWQLIKNVEFTRLNTINFSWSTLIFTMFSQMWRTMFWQRSFNQFHILHRLQLICKGNYSHYIPLLLYSQLFSLWKILSIIRWYSIRCLYFPFICSTNRVWLCQFQQPM